MECIKCGPCETTVEIGLVLKLMSLKHYYIFVNGIVLVFINICLVVVPHTLSKLEVYEDIKRVYFHSYHILAAAKHKI